MINVSIIKKETDCARGGHYDERDNIALRNMLGSWHGPGRWVSL
jgi:hypothetical protein